MPAVLAHLSPLENPPQVVLTALRALSNIVDATRLCPPGLDDATAVSEPLFKSQHLTSLCHILTWNSTSVAVQEQKCLVASLVSRLCRGPQHQNLLAEYGILDALATILASFVASRGEVVPGAEMLGQSDGLADLIPDPAPRGADLALVLEAISVIISGSRFRACMLIYSPAIMAVFPTTAVPHLAKTSKAARDVTETTHPNALRAKVAGTIDYLLPYVPRTQFCSSVSQLPLFPPLGFSPSAESLAVGERFAWSGFGGWDSAPLDSTSSNGDAEMEDLESPLIPWLIHLVRSTEGLERVMATSVLTSLYKAGFALFEREAAIGLLVIPLLCQLIRDHDNDVPAAAQNSALVEPGTLLDWAILEQTPAVLARLIADSDHLQEAAYGCGAMKAIHKLLKDAYEPLPIQTAPRPWSSSPDCAANREEGLPSCRMGPPGQLPIYSHRIRMRESALKLIVGLVAHKEEYRKALAEQDIIPYIVESLSAFPSRPRSVKGRSRADKTNDDADRPSGTSPYGTNPNSVIIAACHVIRVLGRSVCSLRTSLEDHGVAKPVFTLLKHHDAEVQIAACGAICNLLPQCSPMREVRLLWLSAPFPSCHRLCLLTGFLAAASRRRWSSGSSVRTCSLIESWPAIERHVGTEGLGGGGRQ